MLFITQNLFAPNGFPIITQGVLFDQKTQKEFTQQILKNPDFFITDMGGLLEEQLFKKQAEVYSKTLAKDAPQKLHDEYEKLWKLIDYGVTYVHDNYIKANLFYQYLSSNPSMLREFMSTKEFKEAYPERQKSTETELHLTNKDWSTLFSLFTQPIILAIPEMSNPQEKETLTKEAEELKFPYFDLTYDRYKILKESYSKNPYFKIVHAIRECVTCAISRLKHPFVRANYEDNVITSTLKHYSNKKAPLTITAFASGNLYQIFVIINKLIAAGYSSLVINFIDPDYEDFINECQECQQPNKPLGTPSFYFTATPSAEQHDTMSLDRLQLMIRKDLQILEIHNLFVTFSKWFAGTNAQVSCIVYPYTKDYLADCAQDANRKTDILIAADFLEEAFEDFTTLRKNGLKPDGLLFALAHSTIGQSEFYYFEGNQKNVQYYKWNLESMKLEQVSQLPQGLDFDSSQEITKTLSSIVATPESSLNKSLENLVCDVGHLAYTVK